MNPVPATAARARTHVRTRAAALSERVRAERVVLAGLVAALVLGILGMHALTTHGAAPDATAAAHQTAMVTGASHATHDHGAMASNGPNALMDDHTSATTTADTSADNSAAGSGHASGHGLGGMVMLCVVMLAAAALALLALLVTGYLRRVRLRVFEPLAVRVQNLTWIRGNGPPPVWEYSVIRC